MVSRCLTDWEGMLSISSLCEFVFNWVGAVKLMCYWIIHGREGCVLGQYVNHVRMYICMYACTYVCTYVRMHVVLEIWSKWWMDRCPSIIFLGQTIISTFLRQSLMIYVVTSLCVCMKSSFR